jgi:hypothetical protein
LLWNVLPHPENSSNVNVDHLAVTSIGTREITSYNCVTAECDASPDHGAGGRVAFNGVPTGKWFACNWLPFGTKIVIPSISGKTVWTCRDRMARKCGHRIDLLYPIGKTIGLRRAEVFVVSQ